LGYLLYFKLTLAKPVDRDITNPRANKVDIRVDFVEGDGGSKENAFSTAMKNQLTT
jgi:hypothetical protein